MKIIMTKGKLLLRVRELRPSDFSNFFCFFQLKILSYVKVPTNEDETHLDEQLAGRDLF
jgi:hypothetical protein